MSRIFLSQIILRMELNLEGKVIFYISNVVILLCNRYPTREDFTRVAMEIISKYPFMKAKMSPPTVSIYGVINRFVVR